MWPDGAQSITSVTKRPVTAGMDFKNSIIALVEKNLSMKVSLLRPYFTLFNPSPIAGGLA